MSDDVTPARRAAFQLAVPTPHRSGGFLQHQVEQLIRDAIADGTLHEGDQLPSYRAAAATSGLSVNTIVNAYRALISDDIVHAVPSRGYFIGEPIQYRDFFTPRTDAIEDGSADK